MRCVGLPAEVPIEALSLAPGDVPRLLEAHACRDLAALLTQVPRDVPTRVRAVVATPWEGIEGVAQQENVDLIVIGAHGYGMVDRILGTTAAKVVNHADRSVLVVRSVERLIGASKDR
jgi:nucleotide-binding universal stress UspA family protein